MYEEPYQRIENAYERLRCTPSQDEIIGFAKSDIRRILFHIDADTVLINEDVYGMACDVASAYEDYNEAPTQKHFSELLSEYAEAQLNM